MGEEELKQLLEQDLSEGTDTFRDALLARCLEAVSRQEGDLSDTDLEMLAAAGDPSIGPPPTD